MLALKTKLICKVFKERVTKKKASLIRLKDEKARLAELNESNNHHLAQVQAKLEEKKTELADMAMSLKDKTEEVENQQLQLAQLYDLEKKYEEMSRTKKGLEAAIEALRKVGSSDHHRTYVSGIQPNKRALQSRRSARQEVRGREDENDDADPRARNPARICQCPSPIA